MKWFVVENKCPLAGQTLKRLVVVCTMCMLYVETGKYGGGEGGSKRQDTALFFMTCKTKTHFTQF